MPRFGNKVDATFALINREFLQPGNENPELPIGLISYFRQSIASLYLLQQSIIEKNGFQMTKDSLLRHLRVEGSYPVEIKNIVELIMSELSDSLVALKPEILDINVDKYMEEMRERLFSYCVEYGDSPDGRLEELRHRENNPTASASLFQPKVFIPRINRFPVFRPSLDIIAMLRPQGKGNVGGFFNYACRIFGFPVNILMGVENNGDTQVQVI